MPLKLNTNKVVKIAPEFIDLVCDFYNNWALANEQLIRMGASDREKYGSYTMTARRMMPIVRRQSPSLREGLDYELTRFRGLPFTSFEVYEGPEPGKNSGSIRWLVGRTRHITATFFDRRTWNEKLQKFEGPAAGELGPYNIYIPETIAAHPSLANLHMIPQRNLFAAARHYHHAIKTGRDDRATRNPLSYETDNCWGDYQLVLNSLLSVPDLPELFRQLHRHLCTYGYIPPYLTLDFDTTIPEA
jgi:hypothetical protein